MHHTGAIGWTFLNQEFTAIRCVSAVRIQFVNAVIEVRAQVDSAACGWV